MTTTKRKTLHSQRDNGQVRIKQISVRTKWKGLKYGSACHMGMGLSKSDVLYDEVKKLEMSFSSCIWMIVDIYSLNTQDIESLLH